MDIGSLGRILTEYRERSGLTMGALSAASGVAENTILSIEKGRGNPTLSTLDALAKALGADLSDLIKPAKQEPEVDPIDEAYDIRAASAAIKDALDMLHKFANLPPGRQKLVLSIVYDDPSYIRGARPSDVPQWLPLSSIIRRK